VSRRTPRARRNETIGLSVTFTLLMLACVWAANLGATLWP